MRLRLQFTAIWLVACLTESEDDAGHDVMLRLNMHHQNGHIVEFKLYRTEASESSDAAVRKFCFSNMFEPVEVCVRASVHVCRIFHLRAREMRARVRASSRHCPHA